MSDGRAWFTSRFVSERNSKESCSSPLLTIVGKSNETQQHEIKRIDTWKRYQAKTGVAIDCARCGSCKETTVHTLDHWNRYNIVRPPIRSCGVSTLSQHGASAAKASIPASRSPSDHRATAGSPRNQFSRQHRLRQWSMRLCLRLPPNSGKHSSVLCAALTFLRPLPPLDPFVSAPQSNGHRADSIREPGRSPHIWSTQKSRGRRHACSGDSCPVPQPESGQKF